MGIKANWSHFTPANLSRSLIHRPIVVWFAVALILLCGFTGAGAWYYRHQRETFRKDVWSDLNAIADLKVRQISEWRRSRLAEASIILDFASRDPAMERLITGDKQGGRAALEVLISFRERTQAESVVVISPNGRVVWSAPEGRSDVGQWDRALAERASREGKILFSDFHKNADNDIELNIFVPAASAGEPRKRLGVLILRLDPDAYLYPLIQSWPTPSRTAETLLVGRVGASVVYLNELRHVKGTALTLSFPLERSTLPAARAALGIETTMEGIDYRGVPVLAVTRKVPDSPWGVVAKMDQVECYAAAKQMAKITGFQLILLISTLFLALALLLAQKASQIRSRELQARLQYQELARHSDELQRLTAHLDIREEESRRISREIHEEFGNALAGVRFSLLDLEVRVPDDHPEIASRISSVLSEHKTLIEQVRRISQHLRPPILDQLGLVPAIKWLADDFELRTGQKCPVVTEVSVSDGTRREQAYASAVYRICQEALSNVARHANATSVQVVFRETESEAMLQVADNGDGFTLSKGNDSSIGIINMRERARYFGGTFDISASPGEGTTVTVRIPLRKSRPATSYEDSSKKF